MHSKLEAGTLVQAIREMLFLVALQAAPASLLLRDAANPCVAYGNGSIFNITSLFRWPAVVDGVEDADGKQ